MSELLDNRIRSTVVELLDSSPPPHPAHEALGSATRVRSPLSLRSGLSRMAAAALVVLLVGLGVAWLAGNLSSDVVSVPAVDGVASPEPGFDPTQFGQEVRLLPAGGELQPEVPVGTLDGDAVAVGRIEGTDLEVFTWDTVEGEVCVQVAGPEFRDTQCSDTPAGGFDPSDRFDGPDPFVTVRGDGTSDEEVISVWRVPEDTSVVLGLAGSDGVWQRPVSGVSAFVVGPAVSRVVFDAVNTENRTLTFAFFSPRQVVDPVQPGETELQGSPQDLIELDASHPVNQILAEGASDIDTFSEAADKRGLQFICGGGGQGGAPPYGYCLVGEDGTLTVVPFGDAPGLTVRISDPDLVEDVVVPLDRTAPVGVTNVTGGGVPVLVEYFGEEIGSLSRPPLFNGEG